MKIRSKLMAATAMLLVSTIMMTTASFAWFTISTAPEVSNLTTQVVVNDNLEIALAKSSDSYPAANETNYPAASGTSDTGKQTTWGNIIDLSAASDTADDTFDYASVNKVLRPVKLNITKDDADKGKIQYPIYGEDGRVSDLANTTVDTKAPFGNIKGEIYVEENDARVDHDPTEPTSPLKNEAQVHGYYVDIWLRSNKSGAVTLSTAKERASNGETGKGATFTTTNKALAKAIRIGVQVGHDASAEIKELTTKADETGTKVGNVTTYTTTFEGTVVESLTAGETPTHVRLFVYIDGSAITNKDASVSADSDDAAKKALTTGDLNLQFEMVNNVTTSMDVAAADAVGGKGVVNTVTP